jgi:hypothetical protein
MRKFFIIGILALGMNFIWMQPNLQVLADSDNTALYPATSTSSKGQATANPTSGSNGAAGGSGQAATGQSSGKQPGGGPQVKPQIPINPIQAIKPRVPINPRP